MRACREKALANHAKIQMSSKLKLLFIGLSLCALFLVGKFVLLASNSFKNKTNLQSANIIGTIPENPLTIDSDHDGLSDRDEILYGTDPFNPDTDGDGYLDGEEVATGHDPLNAESNDKSGPGLAGTSEKNGPNLTQRFVNHTVASMIGGNGDINTGSMGSAKYADIINTTISNANMAFIIPDIKDTDLIVTNDNSKEAIQSYLSKIVPAVEEVQVGINTLSQQVNSLTGISETTSQYFNDIYYKMTKVAVPSSWRDTHKQVLNLLLGMYQSVGSISATAISDDPIKAMVGLQNFEANIFKARSLLIDISSKATSQKIPTNDTILELLGTANQAAKFNPNAPITTNSDGYD